MARSCNITEEEYIQNVYCKTTQQGTALVQLNTIKMVTGPENMNLIGIITGSSYLLDSAVMVMNHWVLQLQKITKLYQKSLNW
jgi:hypothetical protein